MSMRGENGRRSTQERRQEIRIRNSGRSGVQECASWWITVEHCLSEGPKMNFAKNQIDVKLPRSWNRARDGLCVILCCIKFISASVSAYNGWRDRSRLPIYCDTRWWITARHLWRGILLRFIKNGCVFVTVTNTLSASRHTVCSLGKAVRILLLPGTWFLYHNRDFASALYVHTFPRRFHYQLHSLSLLPRLGVR